MAQVIDENQARQAIEKWRASGLEVVQFTKREGISIGLFYRMRAKVEEPAVAADPCIVPVAVRSRSRSTRASAAPGSPFEVEVVSGMKIRVAVGFDAAELVRLVEGRSTSRSLDSECVRCDAAAPCTAMGSPCGR